MNVLKTSSWLKSYPKGAVINTDVSKIYIVIQGYVLLYTMDKKAHASVGPGGFFNHSALVPAKTSVSAVAITDVVLLPVSRDQIGDLVQNEPAIAEKLILELCTCIHEIRMDYEKLKGEPWLKATTDEDLPKPQETAQNEKASFVQTAIQTQKPMQANAEQENDSPTITAALFPAGHIPCELPLNNSNREYLMEKDYACPLCGEKFTALCVKESKLSVEKTDDDMRIRYKDIEPLYYDVVFCPHCGYSALKDMFAQPEKLPKELQTELKRFSPDICAAKESASTAVFAGYYLALVCTPKCFYNHNSAMAKLYLKLSRIYQDCGNRQMELEMCRQALAAYLLVYEREEIAPAQEQQLMLAIAELYYKLQDLKNARNYFFKVKTTRGGKQIFKDHAAKRLYQIRSQK